MSPEPAFPESKKVLVVEDNALNMKLVRSLLRLGGYRVLEAGDAEKGLHLAREETPDLILMDVQLPGMDGLSATRLLKADPDLLHIPVVALTSHAMQGDEARAREAHCDGYLAKPINTRTFLESIGGFITTGADGGPKPRTEPIRHQQKILIVDDEPLNLKLLSALLPKDTYDILQARTGEEAMEKTIREGPDLILLDIMMPGMDGFEVTRRLKKDSRTEMIPIILVTALDDQEDKVRGLEAGADEFLNKPVNKPELLARIKSLLRLKQYEEQMAVRLRSAESFPLPAGAPEPLTTRKDQPRILLVEDDEKDARLIQTFLQDTPCRLERARNGEEALALIHREKVDLILLDVLLPGLDGFAVCEQLKKNTRTRDIQVVLVTCLSDLESKVHGVELGADDYLIKPINNRELRARLKVLLKKKDYLDKLQHSYEKALNSAVNDGLTGLFHRDYFKRFLELEFKRSLRQKYPLALILIDFDDFKKLNDTLGHLSGDLLLQEAAQVIQGATRETDLAARYGGDEFALVLPYTDQEGARLLAERIKQTIAAHSFPQEAAAQWERVTVSLGVASYPAHAANAEALIRNSEHALFQAKNQGKNRVGVYSGPGAQQYNHFLSIGVTEPWIR